MNWIKHISEESAVLANSKKKQHQFLLLIWLVVVYFLYRSETVEIFHSVRVYLFSTLILLLYFTSFLIYPVLLIWFFIGKIIGEIMSTVLLAVIYYIFIAPLKLFVKYDTTSGWKKVERENDHSKMG